MSAYVTLNALRKYLRGRGCTEERTLQSSAGNRIHLELRCTMKTGKICRAVLGADRAGGQIPQNLLAVVEKNLAACRGHNWTRSVPA
jgi:hypothetical protein